jgi:hypothetical protein
MARRSLKVSKGCPLANIGQLRLEATNILRLQSVDTLIGPHAANRGCYWRLLYPHPVHVSMRPTFCENARTRPLISFMKLLMFLSVVKVVHKMGLMYTRGTRRRGRMKDGKSVLKNIRYSVITVMWTQEGVSGA